MTQTPEQPPTRYVNIELTIELELEPGDFWPDGEPKVWGADEVLAEIKGSGFSAESVIRDWDLLVFGADVMVQVDGKIARGHLR